jgi:hypothetical protein
MKFAYFNPIVVAVTDVPDGTMQSLSVMTQHAHRHIQFNDAGNPDISIRGGQQVQLVPNEFNLNTEILKTYIEQQCQEYLDRVMQVNSRNEMIQVKPMLVSAWTLKQGPGNYQVLHSHESHISGNIYIEVPDFLENSDQTDGCLEFKLPVTKTPGRFIFTDTWRIKPEVGKMVIFPSYLSHTVYPWQGTGHRISLAWDAKLVDK